MRLTLHSCRPHSPEKMHQPRLSSKRVQVPNHYREHFRLYDPIGGEHMNIMKAGLLTAHRIVAVSHGCGHWLAAAGALPSGVLDAQLLLLHCFQHGATMARQCKTAIL